MLLIIWKSIPVTAEIACYKTCRNIKVPVLTFSDVHNIFIFGPDVVYVSYSLVVRAF